MYNNSLMKFGVNVAGVNHDLDFEMDLTVDIPNLSDEFVRQPIKFAHYATLAEFANRRVKELEQEKDLLFAQLYKATSAALTTPDGKAPTETAIKNAIIRKESYNDILKRIADMDHTYNLLKIAKTAFEQRKDMLMMLGSLTKAEMTSTISINQKNAIDSIKKLRNKE